ALARLKGVSPTPPRRARGAMAAEALIFEDAPAQLARSAASSVPKRKREALGDITNVTPQRAPRTRGGGAAGAAPDAALTPQNPPQPAGAGGAGPSSLEVRLQRFTLVSRSAPEWIRGEFQAPESCLLEPPPRLLAALGRPLSVCRCSWEPRARRGERRLCARSTEDHDELRLLRALGEQFLAGLPLAAAAPEPPAVRACCGAAEVHFVLDAGGGPRSTVLGYVAVVRSYEHGVVPNVPGLSERLAASARAAASRRAPLLEQLFVEEGHRRRGVATAALRQLLAGQSAVAVSSPSLGALAVLEKLGFQLVGSAARAGGLSVCLLARARRDDEDQWLLQNSSANLNRFSPEDAARGACRAAALFSSPSLRRSLRPLRR
ncbi:unnamed protein product, partial [Prorocentrum cordatum]